MAKILNNILCTFMIFLLTFAWATYCLKDGKLALAVALTVALCSGYVIFEILGKLEKGKNKKLRHTKQLKNFFEYLRFNEDNEKLFCTMFEFFGYNAERVDFDNAILNREGRAFAAMCFKKETLSADELRQAIIEAKRHNCNRLFIFCGKVEGSVQASTKNRIETKFVDLQNTYDLFVQAQKLPQMPTAKTVQIDTFCQYVFSKKCFRWYFSGAFFTLFVAAFSLLKIYLLVWSTLLFALALFALFNKKYNPKPTNVEL